MIFIINDEKHCTDHCCHMNYAYSYLYKYGINNICIEHHYINNKYIYIWSPETAKIARELLAKFLYFVNALKP